MGAQAEIDQAHLSGIVTEADPAVMPDAVLTAMNDKAIQVFVRPPQGDLQGGMKIRDGAVVADEQAAPDQRADAV
jgi:hypothetical protein